MGKFSDAPQRLHAVVGVDRHLAVAEEVVLHPDLGRGHGALLFARRRPARAYMRIFPSTRPSTTATSVATRPGSMKLWFRTYFPIRVVPVRSKLMAATSVG